MGDIAGTVYQRPGTKKWWLKFYVDGKPVRESSGKEDRDEALERLKVRIGESKPKDKRSIGVLLDGLVEDYEINDKSVDWAKLVVEIHLRPHFGSMRAEKLSKQDVRTYILKRKNLGRKNATINREISLLRRAFNLAEVPFPKTQKLEENNVRRGFQSPESFAQLLSKLPEHLRPIAVFAYETGCRRGEILGLKWEQVDLDNSVIRLQAGETKNGEGRIIPLTDSVVRALRYIPQESEFVFTYRQKADHIHQIWLEYRLPGGEAIGCSLPRLAKNCGEKFLQSESAGTGHHEHHRAQNAIHFRPLQHRRRSRSS